MGAGGLYAIVIKRSIKNNLKEKKKHLAMCKVKERVCERRRSTFRELITQALLNARDTKVYMCTANSRCLPRTIDGTFGNDTIEKQVVLA